MQSLKDTATNADSTTNAATLPPFVSIPFTIAASELPRTHPHRWLNDFGSWALEQVDEAEALQEFFDMSLEKARHEHTIRRFDFWARVTLSDVPQGLLDDERFDNFAAMFEVFLCNDGKNNWRRAYWKASCLTVETLWEALRQNGEADATEPDARKPKTVTVPLYSLEQAVAVMEAKEKATATR